MAAGVGILRDQVEAVIPFVTSVSSALVTAHRDLRRRNVHLTFWCGGWGGAANVTACGGGLDDTVPGNTLSAACSDIVSQRRASPPTPPPRQTQELYPLPPPRPAHRPKVPQTLPCLPYRPFHAPAFRCVTTTFTTPPGTLAGAGRDSPARLVPPFSPHAVPLPRDSREV